MTYTYPFRMCSATATMLAIDPVANEVIIGVRGDDVWVFPGFDSLPGGFMESRWMKNKPKGFKQWVAFLLRTAADLFSPKLEAGLEHEGENLEQTAAREIQEELCIDVELEQLHLFTLRSNPRTDTRAHVVNACYWLELTPEQAAQIKAGDDLKAVKRISIDDVLNGNYNEPMAFNHYELMLQGINHYHEHKEFLRFKELKLEGVA